MSQDIFWLLILGAPVAVTIGLFLLAHRLEKKFPTPEKRILLSFWTGVLGLVPGLANSEVISSSGSFINLGQSPDQGWPFYWWGADGLGLIGISIPMLADILVVAGIAYLGFSLVSRLNPSINAKLKKELYAFLILLFAMTPVWVNLSEILHNVDTAGTITHTSTMSQEQLDYWMKKNAGPLMNSIQLKECTGFQLVPSQTFPETMDIHFSVKVMSREPEGFRIADYGIGGKILDDVGDPMGDPRHNYTYSTDDLMRNGVLRPGEFVAAGEKEVRLIFPIKITAESLNINQPGPYKMIVTVGRITVFDGDWNIHISRDEIGYARDTLGFSDKNLKLECQTPPYTFKDLGVFVDTTPPPPNSTEVDPTKTP
jgi:hypothetical protein